MIGLHGQRTLPNWLDAIRELPAGAPFLSVEDIHMCRDAKLVNPGIVTIFRKKTSDQHLPGITYDIAVAKARAYFDSFVDGTWMQQELWRYVDYVKEWNEYVASSDNEARRQEVIIWLKAVNNVWNTEYRGTAKTGFRDIPLVCLSAPIGNDIDIRYAKIINDHDNVISYHGYTNFFPSGDSTIRNPADWEAYSGRWAGMDARFKAAGIRAKWMSTEGGPFNSSYDGWKSPKCLNGDLSRYIDECVKYQIDNITAWNKANGNRFLGMTLFTFGNTGSWPKYELNTGDMVEIARAVKAYIPQQPPIPPDPPPPVTGDGLPRVQYKRTYLAVPQDATESEWLAICKEAYANKQTVGFSYDDAGIGKLDSKTAVLYSIGNQQLFIDWFAEHYPGTSLEFRDYPKA